METVTLIIALAALVIAVLAYARTGGIRDLRGEVKSVGSAVEVLRARTADALGRLEKAVRGSGERPARTIPGEEEGRGHQSGVDRGGAERGR